MKGVECLALKGLLPGVFFNMGVTRGTLYRSWSWPGLTAIINAPQALGITNKFLTSPYVGRTIYRLLSHPHGLSFIWTVLETVPTWSDVHCVHLPIITVLSHWHGWDCVALSLIARLAVGVIELAQWYHSSSPHGTTTILLRRFLYCCSGWGTML